MRRLGIVIGCGAYASPGSELPAAANDARTVARFLEQGNLCDEVLCLVDVETAAQTKQQLSSFVQKHQASRAQEVIFYFSGHGLYRDGEFFYVLRNYDELRPRETCLENSELDDMLRALSPDLTVKIVDACNSGVPYVKAPLEPTQLEKHIDETQRRFSKCYFLFSSYRDQSSYADDKYSYFTRVLLDSIASHSLGTIRYKDLVSAAADAFEGDPHQRPFFVIQADQTEVFCTLTEQLKRLLAGALEPSDRQPIASEPGPVQLVVSALRRDAARFVTPEVAHERLEALRDGLSNAPVPGPLLELYSTECVSCSGRGTHPGAAKVGEWILDYGADVLAKAKFKLVSEAQTMLDQIAGVVPRKFESKDVESYEHTVVLPFARLELKAVALLPNLHLFKLIVVPVLSRSDVHLFAGICEYGHSTWTDMKLLKNPVWNSTKVPMASGDLLASTVKMETRRLWDALAKHVAQSAGAKKEDGEAFLRLVRESG
ncbi:caspase family protein [Sorangium sp. So ce367]|uniref:caspase family protein n=1 Tax=Sorangium sp. So ce367 TaxID=3133305 RepID=UPI003F620A3C